MKKTVKWKLYEKMFSILYFIATAVVFIIGFMLLSFPEKAGMGITEGINMCVNTLIPSMYPFMFLTTFLTKSRLLERYSAYFSFIAERCFKLPSVCTFVILFSLIGGLPVGAKMVEELYDRGLITRIQGQRMLFFCINPGPAFVISTVGVGMLNSKKIGLILYLSVIIASLSVGFISSFFWIDDVNTAKTMIESTDKPDLQPAFVDSVTQSGRSILEICGWVLIFSCFIHLIEILPLNASLKLIVSVVTEITNGCKVLAGEYPLPLIAGVIGFSGLCAHMQVMPSIIKFKLELKIFLATRVLNAGISILISMALFELFPVSVQTAALGNIPERVGIELSFPVCVGVMMMCVLLLLGDNYQVKNTAK